MNDISQKFRKMSPNAGSAQTSAENDTDRREHFRLLTVMRVARLANKEIEGLGVVRNVSEGGMMIDAHVDVEVGTALTVSLLEDHQVTGEVVWKEGGTIGVAFEGAVDVEQVLARPMLQTDGKRTRLPRLTVNRDAIIHIGDRKVSATVCDVSQRGAKLSSSSRFHINDQVLVALEGCRNVRGTVKWQAGDAVGVEFHRLLGVDELVQWLPKDAG